MLDEPIDVSKVNQKHNERFLYLNIHVHIYICYPYIMYKTDKLEWELKRLLVQSVYVFSVYWWRFNNDKLTTNQF